MSKRVQFVIAFSLMLAVGLLFGLAGPSRADTAGKSGSRIATVNGLSISTGATVISATAGRTIVVESMVLRSDTAGEVKFNDGADGTKIGTFYLEANKPFVIEPQVLGDAFRATAATLIEAELSSATLTATIRYRLE